MTWRSDAKRRDRAASKYAERVPPELQADWEHKARYVAGVALCALRREAREQVRLARWHRRCGCPRSSAEALKEALAYRRLVHSTRKRVNGGGARGGGR